ncbi:unnamed protein product [Parascedosporium putredinis]|uniref:Carboxylic ester hydrolase n=1 Tax=Parascedosporium putredinis TaxID=1442378 RepID=A0A9P1MDG3_9PEZI|nr:unnamed protein product [Parascedosporium putredinis]CAI8000524.1 unnamed protein product [Parascedosporium putredinis]
MRFLFATALLVALAAALGSIPTGMKKALTTNNVPKGYLSSVSLVGTFPMSVLQADQRFFSIPKLPLLVDIHGIGRTTTRYLNDHQLPSFARKHGCAILTPVFPAGIEGPNDIGSFKEMYSDFFRSDLVLLSILGEVGYRWPAIDIDKVYLMGYSAGGQFAHRFLYLHPDRLAAVSIGAPGSVTFLDDLQSWPDGISDFKSIFGTDVDMGKVKEVPIQLVVGNRDRVLHGNPAYWRWLERMLGDEVQEPREVNRLDTVKSLHESWDALGIKAELEIIRGVGHNESNADIYDTMTGFWQATSRNITKIEDRRRVWEYVCGDHGGERQIRYGTLRPTLATPIVTIDDI